MILTEEISSKLYAFFVNHEQSEDKYKNFLCDLEEYITLLLSYNQKYNLIGRSTIDNILTRHVLDSLQLVSFCDIDSFRKIIDIGSGSGMPGMIIAIYFKNIRSYPIEFDLIEKSPVKCTFLKTVIEKLNYNNVNVQNIILVGNKKQKIDFIKDKAIAVSRAFKPISETLDMIGNNQYIEKIIFLKGQNYINDIDEFKQSKQSEAFTVEDIKKSTFNEGNIIVIKRIKKAMAHTT